MFSILVDKTKLRRRIAVAAGKEPADIVIRNGKIVDVFRCTVVEADIAIVDGVFAGIGSYSGSKIMDAHGRYICPSFIDGHVHIESTMIAPPYFAEVVLPHGVTTVIADPHEIANVAGTDGIQFMLDSSEDIPLDVYVMLPSCVPATSFEHAGARLEHNSLDSFYEHPRVLGLGEIMDFESVMNGNHDMIEKICGALRRKVPIDGHGAGLSEFAVNAYAAAGIRSDHECVSANEAQMRLARGMYLMIREGTVAKDLKALIPIVNENNGRRCVFVTDDKHVDDLLMDGSVDHNVRLAVRGGVPVIRAIQMATLNTAECFGLHDRGAIAPGFIADFLLLDDLEQVKICQVYKEGNLVAENGRVLKHVYEKLRHACSSVHPSDYGSVASSIRLPHLSKGDLEIRMSNSTANIIGIIPNSLVTEHLVETVTVSNGLFQPSVQRDQLKIAVIERHHRTGNIGLGIVKGLGIQGSIASTVAHDSHNLIVVGCDDDDMLMAVEEIRRMQGGLTVVQGGSVLASLPLPLAGLLSNGSASDVNRQLEALQEALRSIGATQAFNPFLTLSFLALPVIPKLKLTDMGLFDVERFRHIPVEREQDSAMSIPEKEILS